MERANKARNRSLKSFLIDNAAMLMCILLVIYNAIFSPNFLKIFTLWNLLSQTAALMFAAMGMTLVISCGCTDLSIGSVMAISSSVSTGISWMRPLCANSAKCWRWIE